MQTNLQLSPGGSVPSRFAFGTQLLLFILLLNFTASAQLQLVKDINTMPAGSTLTDNDYTKLTSVNGNIYFVIKNSELWTSSSTGLNASLLKEFEQISNLTDVNGILFFTADIGEAGLELWKSDGTAEGTVLVKDIRPGIEGSSPSGLTNVGGTIYFAAHDGSTGRELWKSNGTAAGTVRVKDIVRVVGSSNPANLVNLNGLLLFTANDAQRGYELWKSDGTTEGTVLVKDIRTEYKVSSSPQELTNVNGTLFFTALVSSSERKLFKSDGTDAGTMVVSSVPTGHRLLTNVNGTLFFGGRDTSHGLELWKSDGTEAGTVLVKDLDPGPGSASTSSMPHLSRFTSINNKLYLLATTAHPVTGSATMDLWISDGTAAGTGKLTQVPEIRFSAVANPFLTSFGGQAYFAATNGSDLNIYRTDGTPDGEEIFLADVAAANTANVQLTVVDSYMYYISEGSLWKTNGIITNRVNTEYGATLGSNVARITDINGTIYFSAYDGTANGLWKSDGTEAGTQLIRHFPGSETLGELVPSGAYLYYSAFTSYYDGDIDDWVSGWNIWKTDLATDVTIAVTERFESPPFELTDVNGRLFFSMLHESEVAQLWKTDGTLASTQLIKTFNVHGYPPNQLTNVNGTLLFAGRTDPAGDELWRSDGTEAGTVMVKKINPNPDESSEPNELINVNNTLYFTALNGYDYELWKSDGTEAGTVMVKDIRADDYYEFDINGLKEVNGTLYFTARGAEDFARDVWKTDGTEAGTVKIATLPAFGSQVSVLDHVNGNLILVLRNPDYNVELWKTDETEVGTQKFADIPDSQGLTGEIAVKDDVIYFTETAQIPYETHLWRTDGTACGTFEFVADEGNPSDLELSGGQIFLAYTHTQYGRELFTVDESEISVPCEAMTTRAASSGRENIFETSEVNGNEKIIAHYPNPFTKDFVLNVSGKEGASFDATIIDVSGKPVGVYNQLLYNQNYTFGSAWTPGVYILHVRKDNGLWTKKIIKTK